ncbi:cyclase family protein [Puniceicoccus vermicola]|uniref:Cyclase family protein n=1 Tax=Puniceicoccus vermicola TaxID=388746 RepID=A0A7X1AYZ1_9BACT|nr:cyclase family protein [Puniceicoccus vermicola]
MRIFDLSQPLFDGCPNCPAHPPIRLPRSADHPEDGWRMEEFHMASHSGTHLDAPLHKIAGGSSIDQFPLEAFCGRPVVADLIEQVSPGRAIGSELLESVLGSGPDLRDAIVLLNTEWGSLRKSEERWLYQSPYLRCDGAEWLIERKIRAVGIDHFSIGGMDADENLQTHEALLGAGLWVVEELNFRDGWKEFLPGSTFQALPLSLPGFSGSPCRAVLIQS